MKCFRLSLSLLLFTALAVSAQNHRMPSMYPEGTLPPERPNYVAKSFSLQTVEMEQPVLPLNFDPGLPDGGRVALVVESGLYNSISSSISTYVADLTAHGFSPFIINFSGTAEELRALFQGYYSEQDSLEGAILIGDLPYALWEMEKQFGSAPEFYESFVCDIFFMDLDGIWEDLNEGVYDQTGRYDSRSGDLYCEIWVSRITAHNLTIGSNSSADLINSYFTKNHAYRDGTTQVNKTALHYTDNDWADDAEEDAGMLEAAWYPVTARAVGIDVGAGGSDYCNNYLPSNVEMIQVVCHGTATGHYWDDGFTVTSSDYLIQDPQAVFYNICSCSSGDLTSDNCLNQVAVMNPEAGGLASWSSSGVGGMLSFSGYQASVFYNALGSGECVGEAQRVWYNSCVKYDERYVEGYEMTPKWFNGMRIDGDGCLTVRTPTIRYVSKTGSDTSPYTTEATAARSVNDAFDAASPGDIILIDAGSYTLTEELYMDSSKEIVIRGSAPSATAILDASQIESDTKRCIRTAYGTSPVIENLTLTGGDVTLDSGGGYKRGAGANLKGGTIRDCVITGNTSRNGGGLFLSYDSVVQNCVIANNHSTSGGGGIHTMDSSENVVVSSCIITNNSSAEYAGGILSTSGGLFENCLIADNTAVENAGGVYMVDSATHLVNCEVRGNRAGVDSSDGSGGGGVYGSKGSIVNTLIADNSADGEGGGIYSVGWSGQETTLCITNVTIAGNSSLASVGGMYMGSHVQLLNCIVADNGDINFYWNGTNDNVDISYSCLDGSSYSGPGVNNISVDPGFIGSGDYSLSSNSDCVNVGLTVLWMSNGEASGQGQTPSFSLEQYDLAGNPRVIAGIVDMGAYEVIGGVSLYPQPGSLQFSCYENYPSTAQELTICSSTSNAVPFNCASSTNWLQLSSELTIGGSVSDEVSITGVVQCASAGLPVGTHSASVNVFTNGFQTFQVLVNATVMPLVTDLLTFDPIDSPQGTGVAFNVTLTASNNAGLIAINHDDDVFLSAYAPGGLVSSIETSGTSTSEMENLLYAYYHDSRSQIIYLSSELGSEAGSITNIAFYVTEDPGQTLNSFTVRFQHTTLTALDSDDFVLDGWHTGFSGNFDSSYFAENSWVNIPVDPPFEYNGTDNLWVDFSFNNGSWSSNGEVRYSSNGFKRHLHGYSDSNQGDPLLWGAGNNPPINQLTYVPNLQFMMSRELVEEVSLAPSVAAGVDFNNGVWSDGVVIDSAYSNVYIVAECGSILATSTIFHVVNELPCPIPAIWLSGFSLPSNTDPYGNPDNDPFTTLEEYIADTNPMVSNDHLRVTAITNNSPATVYFNSSALRNYTLMGRTNLTEGAWSPLVGPRIGTGGTDSMTDDGAESANFYKIRVELP